MPGVNNTSTKAVLDCAGREIAPGAILIHADEEADQPAPENGGGRGHGPLSTPTAQQTANPGAALIAALPLNLALHRLAGVTDTAVLTAMATDTRLKLKLAANRKLALVNTART
jgi:hypothetical protein